MKKIFVIALLGLAACGGKESPESIYRESMAIHDEVMAKMDKIYGLKVSLTEIADSLQADSTHQNPARLTEVQQAIDSLALAEQTMMDWMHHTISPTSATSGHGGHHMGGATSDDVNVHQQQKASILSVKARFERVIPYAEGVLNKP